MATRRLPAALPKAAHVWRRGASSMRAAHIYQYGDVQDVVQVRDGFRLPSMRAPDELLVRVHAASLNPLDADMAAGYAAHALAPLRLWDAWPESAVAEFPTILGRDLSGEVVAAGPAVPPHLARRGTAVVAATWPWQSGCLAEFAVVSARQVALKPAGLSHEEAAALPYAAQTAATALRCWGGLAGSRCRPAPRRVLIHGASGGVGLAALQLCRAWAAPDTVLTATCRRDTAAPALVAAGAEHVFVLPRDELGLAASAHFDLVLDCAAASGTTEAAELLALLAPAGGLLLRLRTPVGQAMSAGAGGPLAGAVNTLGMLLRDSAESLLASGGRRQVRWAVVRLSGKLLGEICALAEDDRLRLPVQRVFQLDECREALQATVAGPNLGKTVIRIVT